MPGDAEYNAVAGWLHPELGRRNLRMEAMTWLAWVTQAADSFKELGRKIQALVNIAVDGAGENVWEQQAVQTFLQAISGTLSWEILQAVNL